MISLTMPSTECIKITSRGRDDGDDDYDEAVKSMAAAKGLRWRLDLTMTAECGFSLCVFTRMSWVPSQFILGLTRQSHRHVVRSGRTGGADRTSGG
jgi:hypothetical protein